MNRRKFLSVKEICEITGFCKDTVYRRIREGVLPAIKFGQKLLVPLDAFEHLFSEGERQHDSGAAE